MAIQKNIGQTHRLRDIDICKGLGILLVVLGHIGGRNPTDLMWYADLQKTLYHFHMAFFMYLSGYVFFLKLNSQTVPLLPLIKTRASRLLLPFALFGLLIVAAKSIARQHLAVDNANTGLLESLSNLIWHTAESPAMSVWYLVVLFLCSIVTAAFYDRHTRALELMMLAAFILYWLHLPAYGYLNMFARYWPFFLIAGFVVRNEAYYRAFIVKNTRLIVTIFLTILAFVWLGWRNDAALFIAGTASIPALHGLVLRYVEPADISKLFVWLSGYSMVIYLLNTLAIGATKAALIRFIPWNAEGFPYYILPLMLAGVFAPIIVKKLVLNRIIFLRNLTN